MKRFAVASEDVVPKTLSMQQHILISIWIAKTVEFLADIVDRDVLPSVTRGNTNKFPLTLSSQTFHHQEATLVLNCLVAMTQIDEKSDR